MQNFSPHTPETPESSASKNAAGKSFIFVDASHMIAGQGRFGA